MCNYIYVGINESGFDEVDNIVPKIHISHVNKYVLAKIKENAIYKFLTYNSKWEEPDMYSMKC